MKRVMRVIETHSEEEEETLPIRKSITQEPSLTEQAEGEVRPGRSAKSKANLNLVSA